jgi:hypothetical protein
MTIDDAGVTADFQDGGMLEKAAVWRTMRRRDLSHLKYTPE